ncbi:MAG: winged helix-turn-helix transcriptional regulator [Gammaproteobacteria bacterium]|nr:winged helix-turn-helix transcriptional regulator [Gammaproteobacteria bacterium]
MADRSEVVVPEDFKELTELHDNAAHAVELLKAMANEWRLMILCQLSEGEKTVSELQAILGLSQSALSQHLAILRRDKLVETRRSATTVNYSVASPEALAMMETLYGLFCRKPADVQPRRQAVDAASHAGAATGKGRGG